MRISYHIPRDSRQFDGHFVDKGTVVPNGTPVDTLTPIGEPKDEFVYYVNGINTSLDKQRQDMMNIAAEGRQVIGIHNATAGVARDLAQCLMDKFDTLENGAVTTVKDLVRQSVNTGKKLAMVAHSQGALICSRALWEVQGEMLENGITEDQAKEKLGVVELETAGGAAHTYPDGPDYHHRVNRLDPVPGTVGVNSYVPGIQPGAGAKITTVTRSNEHYWDNSESYWDYLPNYLDRTVHGVEVYYNNDSADLEPQSTETSKENEPTSLPS